MVMKHLFRSFFPSLLFFVLAILLTSCKVEDKGREKSRSLACLNNEKMILLGLVMYCEDYGFLPPSDNYRELFKNTYGDEIEKLWHCPSGGEFQYVGITSQSTIQIKEPSATVFLICSANHGGRQNIGFADGHVESLPAEQVKAALDNCQPGEWLTINPAN